MIYIYYDNFLILDTIAHEFCHLIWFNYEFDEVHFLLEGLAEYATYMCGYLEPYNNESRRTSYYLEDSDDPLIYFDVAARDYGNSYLFTFYLAERFGVEFLRDLVQQQDDGALGLETALEYAGYNISFNQLYLDWVTALTIDELGFQEDKYGFHNLDVTIQDATTVTSLPLEISNLEVWCYAPIIYQLTNLTDGVTINIDAPTSGKIGVSVAYQDTEDWHITQSISSESIIKNITGISIESAYVIVSHFYADTPAGNIDFGEGIAEEIDLSISTYVGTTSSITTTTSDAVAMNTIFFLTLGVLGICIIVMIVFSKKQSFKIEV
jgi:hypothetical protein